MNAADQAREAQRIATERCYALEPQGVDRDERYAAFLMDYWAERDGLTPQRVAGIVAKVWPWKESPRPVRVTTFDADAVR